MKKIIYIFFLTIPILCSANERLYIVAKVNDSIITNIDLSKEMGTLKVLYNDEQLQRVNVKQVALNNLIEELLKKEEIKIKKANYDLKDLLIEYKKIEENLKTKNAFISEDAKKEIYKKIKLDYEWNMLMSNMFSWKININIDEINKVLENDINKITNQEEALSLKEKMIISEKNKKINIYAKNHLEYLKKNAFIKIIK